MSQLGAAGTAQKANKTPQQYSTVLYSTVHVQYMYCTVQYMYMYCTVHVQ